MRIGAEAVVYNDLSDLEVLLKQSAATFNSRNFSERLRL